MTARDNSIDILRSIALIGMIIAHCNPSQFIMQLRGFDVPLIVFLSGVSYVISVNKNNNSSSYKSYCWKRVKRLVFPTWCFLLLYYAILFAGLSYTGNLFSINWKDVFCNISLITGWYVWIIRVFLIISLVAPFVYSFINKTKPTIVIALFVLVLIGHELIAEISKTEWYYYFTMIIPYVLVFAYGSMSNKLTKKHFFAVAFISLVVFVAFAIRYWAIMGAFQTTQFCKYPPRIYYLSYAIAITSLLWVQRKKIEFFLNKIQLSAVFTFIGSHTLWIYFWHIIFLLIFGGIIRNTYFLFCSVLLFSVIADCIQVKVIKWLNNRIKNDSLIDFLNTMFLG